jgi:hypothetical protein
VSQQESVWTLVLGIAVSCALIRRYAWGWAVYFLVFSLIAAYSFWRIV